MKTPDLRHISTERLSQSVLYLLTTLIAIVFALFYLVGYKHPFEENPDFNAPSSPAPSSSSRPCLSSLPLS